MTELRYPNSIQEQQQQQSVLLQPVPKAAPPPPPLLLQLLILLLLIIITTPITMIMTTITIFITIVVHLQPISEPITLKSESDSHPRPTAFRPHFPFPNKERNNKSRNIVIAFLSTPLPSSLRPFPNISKP
jgi:hypothetical protein